MKKLYVVGIGPGDYGQMTINAVNALNDSSTIVGYTVYVDLLREHFKGREFLNTPMKRETERCHMAFAEAQKGKTVSMVCSGDAGVYGMAGLILELAGGYPDVEVKIIPGVTAALSGGALLGAPLGHDFAVISLSDLLTPFGLIEKRIECAAKGDFAICIYNPSSQKRADYLKHACNIILKYQSENIICGIAENIAREGECISIMTLGELKDRKTDMFSTVFIGNSCTVKKHGYMVTPRGYKNV